MALESGVAPGAEDAAGPMLRREWLLPRSEPLGGLLGSIVGGDEAGLVRMAPWLCEDSEQVDLLLCTHGSRDVCCGRDGTAIFGELAVELRRPGLDPGRVWRSSHLGGHRFAPTALSLPDGLLWAHLDREQALSVLRRDGPAGELSGLCRGSVALADPRCQIADREALAR